MANKKFNFKDHVTIYLGHCHLSLWSQGHAYGFSRSSIYGTSNGIITEASENLVKLFSLTVALILGTSVPKVSKMAITAEMNVIAQK